MAKQFLTVIWMFLLGIIFSGSSSSSESRLPDIPLISHMKSKRNCGFGNVREIYFFMWLVANQTQQHTLVFRSIHGSDHDQQKYDASHIFDTEKIGHDVKGILLRDSDVSGRDGVSLVSEKLSKSELVALKNSKNTHVVLEWAYIFGSFPWLYEDRDTMKKLMKAFQYNDKIQRIAEKIINAHFPDGFNAAHWRFGDSERWPQMECGEYGWSEKWKRGWGGPNNGVCVDESGDWIGYKDVFQRFDNRLPIFIGTNQKTHEKIAEVRGMGLELKLWDDVKPEEKLTELEIQCVEQVLMSKATQFVPALFSSLSEMVILMRAVAENGDEPNLKRMFDLQAN